MSNTAAPLRHLELLPRGGATFVPLPDEQVVARFGALAQTRPFFHLALADTEPRSAASLQEDLGKWGQIAAWEVQGGPGGRNGATLWASTIRGTPHGALWRDGQPFDGEASATALVALAEALFRQRPDAERMLTTVLQSESMDAEDALSPLGFERIQGAFDAELGEISFAIRREVLQAYLAAEQYEGEDEDE